MFNDQKKNAERLKILNLGVEQVEGEVRGKSREIHHVNSEIERAGRNRNYSVEAELKTKAIALQQENVILLKRQSQLRSERDELSRRVDAAIRKSLSGTGEFKQYEEVQRSYDALEQREKELSTKARVAEREADAFIGAGASAHYGNAGDGWEKYKKRSAELSQIASNLREQYVEVRTEKERLQKSELAPASSALYRLELQKFEELMEA